MASWSLKEHQFARQSHVFLPTEAIDAAELNDARLNNMKIVNQAR